MTQWQEFLDPNWMDNALVISTRGEEESGKIFFLILSVFFCALPKPLYHSLPQSWRGVT